MIIGQAGKMCFSRMSEGEDVLETIKKCAEENSIHAGAILVIGTLRDAVLGYYKNKEYKYIHLNAPLEIASCIGNVAVDDKGEVLVHAHIVVSDENGQALGGHLMKGCHVGATAELVIIEGKDVNLQRVFDEKTKLNILKLG
ncbi:MAG TPA: PPC domain-containing DNA-binding protein [Candidatus Bathyarchaeia archaeon]